MAHLITRFGVDVDHSACIDHLTTFTNGFDSKVAVARIDIFKSEDEQNLVSYREVYAASSFRHLVEFCNSVSSVGDQGGTE